MKLQTYCGSSRSCQGRPIRGYTKTEGGDEAEANRHQTVGRIAAAADRGDKTEANTTTANRGDEADAGRANEGNNSGILTCFEDI